MSQFFYLGSYFQSLQWMYSKCTLYHFRELLEMIAFFFKFARILTSSVYTHIASSCSLPWPMWAFYVLCPLLYYTWERCFEHLIGKIAFWLGSKLQKRSFLFLKIISFVNAITHLISQIQQIRGCFCEFFFLISILKVVLTMSKPP